MTHQIFHSVNFHEISRLKKEERHLPHTDTPEVLCILPLYIHRRDTHYFCTTLRQRSGRGVIPESSCFQLGQPSWEAEVPVKLIKVKRSCPFETAAFKHWPTHFQNVINKNKKKKKRETSENRLRHC